MEQNIEDKQNEIIKWLKEFKRLSTSRFTGLLGANYEVIKKYFKLKNYTQVVVGPAEKKGKKDDKSKKSE